LAKLFNGSINLLRSSVELLFLLAGVNSMTRKARKLGSWGAVTLFESACEKHPNQSMIILADDGRSITYRDMDEL
jgi:hypothetical protein